MTPVPRDNYRIGLPKSGELKEIFNTDLKKYFGSGEYKNGVVSSEEKAHQFRDVSTVINIPPLGAVVFKYK
jgi:1,4-alpha-glucan branching enzyme